MALSLRSAFDSLTYGIFSNTAPVKYVASNTAGYGNGIYGHSAGNGLDLAETVGTLYAIVDLFATSVAGTNWHLYRVHTDGRRAYGPNQEDRTEVLRHAALVVLNRPNPFMTRNELFERSEQYIDIIGESFWIVERVGTLPVAIWPVRPDRMVEDFQGGHLAGWEYRSPDGTRVPLDLDEVIHIKSPDPKNLFRGTSPVRALTTDLEAVALAGQYNRNFFLNSAKPGGIIEVPGQLGDTSMKRLQLQWGENHRGPSNAHRVGILENDAKWKDVSISNKDMEFVELRNLSRDLIREAYRVHPHMLGQSDDVNRAAALAASTDFGQWLLTPRLERFKLALNTIFLPMFGETGQGVEFCYDDPTPEFADEVNADRDSRVQAAVALIGQGADPTETLEAFGLPDITFKEPEPVPAELPIEEVPPTADMLRELSDWGKALNRVAKR